MMHALGIVTITKTAGPSSDSDDIFQGSSSFHLMTSVFGIQAEVVIAKEFLNIACSLKSFEAAVMRVISRTMVSSA